MTTIVHQVFEAIDGQGVLAIDEKISLELLERDQDGIFPTEKQWRRFLYGNFGTGDGSYYLSGEPSKNLLKKYCYKLDDYKHLFVQRLGGGKFVPVAAEHLEFTFEYDANYFDKNSYTISSMVEIFVKATLKE